MSTTSTLSFALCKKAVSKRFQLGGLALSEFQWRCGVLPERYLIGTSDGHGFVVALGLCDLVLLVFNGLYKGYTMTSVFSSHILSNMP